MFRYLSLVVLFGPALFAQVNTATLLDTVRDSSGGLVPNASVTARNLQTSAERSVITDASGNYSISNLQPGNYRVVVSSPGFKTSTVNCRLPNLLPPTSCLNL